MIKRKSTKRITMSEIAKQSGTSRQVVSAILQPEKNSSIRYSQETYDKVIKIADKVNYRPNRTARSLLSKRHGSIGILLHTLGNIREDVLCSMLQKIKDYDQVLIMDNFTDNEQEMPLLLKEDMVDGIVVFENIPEIYQQEIKKLKIPCIQVNSNIRDQAGSITYDEESAMSKAIEYLLAKGRSNLALIQGKGNHYSSLSRKKSFIKVSKRSKTKHLICNVTLKDRKKTLIDFLKKEPQVDGVILSIDAMAPDFYQAAKALRKKIAKDISVIGVNNSRICNVIDPPLTAMGVDYTQIGQQIIDELNKYIENGTPKKYPFVIPYELIEREST